MRFDVKHMGTENNIDKRLKTLNNSPAIRASQIFTLFLPQTLNEICKRLNFLLVEKEAGKKFKKFSAEFIAILFKVLKYCCTCTQQHSTLVELFF